MEQKLGSGLFLQFLCGDSAFVDQNTVRFSQVDLNIITDLGLMLPVGLDDGESLIPVICDIEREILNRIFFKVYILHHLY